MGQVRQFLWVVAIIVLAGCANDESDGQITGTYDFAGSVSLATSPAGWIPGDTTLTKMWISFPPPETTESDTVKVYAEAIAVMEQGKQYALPLLTNHLRDWCNDYGPLPMTIKSIDSVSFNASTTYNRCERGCLRCLIPESDTTVNIQGTLLSGLLTLELKFNEKIIGQVTLSRSKQDTQPEFECPDATSCLE